MEKKPFDSVIPTIPYEVLGFHAVLVIKTFVFLHGKIYMHPMARKIYLKKI